MWIWRDWYELVEMEGCMETEGSVGLSSDYRSVGMSEDEGFSEDLKVE